tara:strand:+ start:122 stop:973 length:852 start_codon:yes stop_codon:yes gene_type:complete
MGYIQPGTGYNFVNSEDGASLEILFPEVTPYGPEQFKVEMDGDNVRVAKGRVVAQDVTNAPGTILHEYDVQGFAVYPTGKLTEGTDTNSVYLSQGGYVEIDKYVPAEGEEPATGSNAWGVYLIRNVDNIGDIGQVIMPFLAVMADGSDAENFSTPWESGAEKGFYLIRKKQSVEIVQGEEVYYGGIIQSITTAVNRHQCQRIKIAAINWVDTYWKVTQHLIGSLYMPNNVHFAGELEYEDPDDPPNIDWPLNTAENESWSDPWTGYTKNFNSGGLSRTVNIPV